MVVTATLADRHAEPVDEHPDPEVPERASRRTYSAQYKLKILAEYERRDRDGKGALLRREGLYSSLISEWRKQRDQGALEALPASPGRPPRDSRDHELGRLRRENARLQADLAKAHKVIEVQGKLSAASGHVGLTLDQCLEVVFRLLHRLFDVLTLKQLRRHRCGPAFALDCIPLRESCV
jgi:transposase-like protein